MSSADLEPLSEDVTRLVKEERLRGKRRAQYFRRTYSLEPEDCEELEGGVCEICGSIPDRGPRVDHCHLTGRLRGFICTACNLRLGRLGDDIPRAERQARRAELAAGVAKSRARKARAIVDYLRKYGAKTE